ncbi:type IV secretion system DNA-binding domain-containing protein [Actinocatenispora rupis]|uniref:Type VI secretion protein n=1 Tax=Actinocatenispora rupis TaxID=519421 RepID=A0A8J3IUN0_9ACTN|nr:type IV secretion system DNA-binding domain-containing protein [Actinocatenispora rupis]GID10226.1 hypothetical protein Aru02nite_11150 [Actinocatenispora rupis]
MIALPLFAHQPGPYAHLSQLGQLLAHHHTALIAVAVAALIAATVARPTVRGVRQARWCRSGQRLEILPPPEVEPAGVGQLWATLAGVLTPPAWRRLLFGIPHVGLEYRWDGRALSIGLWIPARVPVRAVQAAVMAAWPGASCTPAEDTAPIPDEAWATGGALAPALPALYPLNTAHTADPLRPLISAATGLRGTDVACVQILARPATPRQHARLRRDAAALRAGRRTRGVVSGLLDLATPGPTPKPHQRASAQADPWREREARAAMDKATQPQWQTAIRYAVATRPSRGSQGRPSPAVRARLRTIAQGMAAASAVYTARNHLRRRRLHRPAAALASRRLLAGSLLSAEELSAIAALPRDLAVPGLDRARAKTAPAPVQIVSGGRNTKRLGVAAAGGHPVALTAADARQHVHMLGATGSGKSTLLTNMILDDVAAHRAVVVVDPKGDLVTDILDRLPASTADRVWLVDPEQDHTPVINPLDGDDHDLVVDNVCSIFGKIFQRHWGPRIDDVLRVACLTLLRHANATLTLVPPLLQDKQFRAQLTAELDDPDGLGGFWTWYESMGDAVRAQIIGPVLARLRAVLLRDFPRRTLGQPRSSLDMRKVLDHGGIVLARLPKGTLGEDTCRLLGSFLLAQTWQAATARIDRPEERRRDCSAYLDECQNFLTLPNSVDSMLAEARGYHLSLTLAHQDLAQLPAEVESAISANARNKIIFACSPEDARILSRHTLPELDQHDLSHLDAYTAAARLMVDNRQTAAFSLHTAPPKPVVGAADDIRRSSSLRAEQTAAAPSAISRLARASARRRCPRPKESS